MDLTKSSRRVGLPIGTRSHHRLSRSERADRGRSLRGVAPRSSQDRWSPSGRRPDPVGLLEEQAATRVPDLVPIRYGRMLVSPFTFYRGAALIMASDLATTPRSGLDVQCCGDAHLSNFGLFGSPERQLMFDVNDFDETHPGPWEWDVKRLAASFEIAGRDRGFSADDRRGIVTAAVREYRTGMRWAADHGSLDVWYSHMETRQMLEWVEAEARDEGLATREVRGIDKQVAKARTRDRMRSFSRLTTRDEHGRLGFVADPPLIVPLDDLVLTDEARHQTERSLRKLIKAYRRTLAGEHHPLEDYGYEAMARKVVGVGSVGTRAWIFLMLGVDEQDPLILQAKEAQPSVLERFTRPSPYANHGERVVHGQHLMQTATDIFLGWQRVTDIDGETRDYYVRQLHDWKGSADVDAMGVDGAALYARMCGATLARAHARSGDWIAIASYLGNGDGFDRAVARFSSSYADQNERDYEALVRAARSGRIEAATGL